MVTLGGLQTIMPISTAVKHLACRLDTSHEKSTDQQPGLHQPVIPRWS
jgi:hypothetical protein